MTTNDYLIFSILILGISALVGIFKTKTQGFGRYSTSLLLLTLALFFTALFFAAGKIESNVFANIVFSVAGFAGGLITNNKDSST
jgi:NADH:ubiquinone oxidoreductase subunit K